MLYTEGRKSVERLKYGTSNKCRCTLKFGSGRRSVLEPVEETARFPLIGSCFSIGIIVGLVWFISCLPSLFSSIAMSSNIPDDFRKTNGNDSIDIGSMQSMANDRRRSAASCNLSSPLPSTVQPTRRSADDENHQRQRHLAVVTGSSKRAKLEDRTTLGSSGGDCAEDDTAVDSPANVQHAVVLSGSTPNATNTPQQYLLYSHQSSHQGPPRQQPYQSSPPTHPNHQYDYRNQQQHQYPPGYPPAPSMYPYYNPMYPVPPNAYQPYPGSYYPPMGFMHPPTASAAGDTNASGTKPKPKNMDRSSTKANQHATIQGSPIAREEPGGPDMKPSPPFLGSISHNSTAVKQESKENVDGDDDDEDNQSDCEEDGEDGEGQVDNSGDDDEEEEEEEEEEKNENASGHAQHHQQQYHGNYATAPHHPYYPPYMMYPPHPSAYHPAMASAASASTGGMLFYPPPPLHGVPPHIMMGGVGAMSSPPGGAMNTSSAAAAANHHSQHQPQMRGDYNNYAYTDPSASALPIVRPPNPSSRGVLLHLQCDVDQLSDYQILVRQQLELFEAGPEDVESNTQGRKKPVLPSQVGLRCIHCAGLPLRARGRGAVYYPTRLQGIYQAAQNMAASHLCQSCQTIPHGLKEELRKLRERRDNASGGKQYWAKAAEILGVIEADNGLFFRSVNPQKPNISSVVKSERADNSHVVINFPQANTSPAPSYKCILPDMSH